MVDEMMAIEANGTWDLADIAAGHPPMSLNWIFMMKKDAANIITKYKVRLMTKGYVQHPGVDIDEVFTPMAWLEFVQLLAYAARQGWPNHHMDVKSAFLNGELQEEV
jgi:hypothetical protein